MGNLGSTWSLAPPLERWKRKFSKGEKGNGKKKLKRLSRKRVKVE